MEGMSGAGHSAFLLPVPIGPSIVMINPASMLETGDSATEMGHSKVLYNKDSAFYNFCAYGHTKCDPSMGRVYHTKDGAPGLMDSRSQWAADLYRGGEVLLGPTPIDNVQLATKCVCEGSRSDVTTTRSRAPVCRPANLLLCRF